MVIFHLEIFVFFFFSFTYIKPLTVNFQKIFLLYSHNILQGGCQQKFKKMSGATEFDICVPIYGLIITEHFRDFCCSSSSDSAEWKPSQIGRCSVPWCSTNTILLVACVVTNTHRRLTWPTSKVWHTYPDHTPDVVSLQLTLLCKWGRFQWTSDPSQSAQGKLMSFGESQTKQQCDSYLALKSLRLSRRDLNALSKTSKSPLLQWSWFLVTNPVSCIY